MYTIREIGENIKDSKHFNGNVLFNIPMSEKTTMHVGGEASLIIEPFDETSLSFALKYLSSTEYAKDFHILGGGSNIIASDTGIKIPIISLRKLKAKIEIIDIKDKNENAEQTIKCSAGMSWAEIFKFCTEHSFTGLLEFTGLPGTVGGACYMNASCFNSSIAKVLLSAEYMTEDGEKRVYEMNQDDWDYKKSPFQTSCEGKKNIVTSATFKVYTSNSDIHSQGLAFIQKRKEKGHYKKHCAGSVFKNPKGEIAGKLIEECGLKGFSIGGAQIASWHANIIINENNAKQTEISKLMDYIVDIVKQQKNIKLIPEIIFW